MPELEACSRLIPVLLEPRLVRDDALLLRDSIGTESNVLHDDRLSIDILQLSDEDTRLSRDEHILQLSDEDIRLGRDVFPDGAPTGADIPSSSTTGTGLAVSSKLAGTGISSNTQFVRPAFTSPVSGLYPRYRSVIYKWKYVVLPPFVYW